MPKILCIDDSADLRISIVMTLEMEGYEVLEAADGQSGLNMALETKPDLILCDILMPGMDGFATLKEIRNHKETEKTPVILMTGEDPRTYLREGMNLGANDFLIKPFKMDDLNNAVKTRLKESERSKTESQKTIDEISQNIAQALPHELRTPMTGILGLAELLKNESQNMSVEEIQDLANSIFTSAVRMNQTLEKFWIYTQCLLLANNKTELNESIKTGTKNTEQIIANTLQELQNTYNRNNDVILKLVPMSLAISSQYFEIIIKQLADNAFKFSDEGSKVFISSFVEENTGIILIENDGKGMEPEHINKINNFMQFNRQKEEQQGLGLGLIISKRLTELHHGNINLSSEKGKSTKVKITLPLSNQ